jgi:sortase A
MLRLGLTLPWLKRSSASRRPPASASAISDKALAELFGNGPHLDPDELARRLGELRQISLRDAIDEIEELRESGRIEARREGWSKRYYLAGAPPVVRPGRAAAAVATPAAAGVGAIAAPVATAAAAPAGTGAIAAGGLVQGMRTSNRRRALAIGLVVLGLFGLTEVVLTVLWKEPLSAIYTSRIQGELLANYDSMRASERQIQATFQAERDQKREMQQSANDLQRTAEEGDALGKIKIQDLGLQAAIVQGTRPGALRNGPGHYEGTYLPGQKGKTTVGLAGHITTYSAPFKKLDELRPDDRVVLEMPYGRFVYSVQGSRVVDEDYAAAFVNEGYDKLVLTTCYPLETSDKRLLVFGKLDRATPAGSLGDESES